MHKTLKSAQEKKRQECVSLLRNKVSRKKITKRVKVSRSTVYRAKIRIQTKKSTRRKKGSGRPKQLLRTHKLAIRRLLRTNPLLSCEDIRIRLNLTVSTECIRLYLIESGFTRRKPYSNFFLTDHHV